MLRVLEPTRLIDVRLRRLLQIGSGPPPRPDAPARTLHWRPALNETHRVAGLPVGGARVSLEVTPAAGDPGRLHARVRSSAPVRLHVSTPDGEQWAEVEEGAELSVGVRRG